MTLLSKPSHGALARPEASSIAWDREGTPLKCAIPLVCRWKRFH